MALQEWVSTNSPLVYWYNMVLRYLDAGKATFKPSFFNMEGMWATERKPAKFLYGLPLKDAKKMCKTFYKESIAKVTLEILQPMVLQVKKDVRATFTERLGVAGA